MDGDEVVWELLELDDLLGDGETEGAPGSIRGYVRGAAHWVEAVSEHLSRRPDDGFGAGDRFGVVGGEVRPRGDLTIDRYLIAEPGPVAHAFDTWLALGRREICVRRAELSLAGDTEPPRDGQLRVLPAWLRSSRSHRRLSVAVELIAWGRYRTLLRFQPTSTHVRSMRPHGRATYFAAGHDCIDVLRGEIVAQLLPV
ncbi:MAG: hypothetical protein AB7Q42_10840 [Acidimicrobiia bacterium]